MEHIGGQAVIEGVMMKSRTGWSVAVRDSSGKIHIKTEPLRPLPRPLRAFGLRGVVALFHALTLGIKAMEFSASKAYGEEEKPMGRTTIALTIGAAFLLGIALFILFPLYATKLAGNVIPRVSESSFLFNAVDGVIRVFVFLLYVILIGLWKEMRRVFEYHGAEHKVIHAYENGMPLNSENFARFSPLHPRCGTSFLLIVMVISIIVFSLIPQSWSFLYKFLSRIVLIPIIAGSSYEFLKLSAKISNTAVGRLMVMPGLMLQRLTTREPDEKQLDVALAALVNVLDGNGLEVKETVAGAGGVADA